MCGFASAETAEKKLRRLGPHQPRWLRQPTVEERHGEDGGEGGVQEGVQRQCHHRPNDLCWHQGGRQRCLPGGPIDILTMIVLTSQARVTVAEAWL